MSLVLAFLGFFVAVFLPGSVLYKLSERYFKHDVFFPNVWVYVIVCFGLSLVFNFFMVSLLVWLHLYTHSILISLTFLEILGFLWVYKRELVSGLKCLEFDSHMQELIYFAGIGICIYVFCKKFGLDIFYAWDSVVSWNRWAGEWASGKFVLNEGGYAQIYPILLSLGYVLSSKISDFQGIGVTIYWYFALMGLLGCVFLLFDKNNLKLSALGFVVLAFFYIVYFAIKQREFHVGYVDMPVSLVILLSALCLLRASFETSQKDVRFYLYLGALLAGVSAEIKQSGLFWCVMYIIGLLYFWRFSYFTLSLKVFGVCVGIIIFLCAPWILIALYKKLFLSVDATNIQHTWQEIYQGKSYLERLSHALTKYYQMSVLFFLSLISLFSKRFAFFGVVGVVYFLLWGCLLSYDLRNLQGGLPMMILALSGGVWSMLNSRIFFTLLEFLHKRLALILLLGVIATSLSLPFVQEKILTIEQGGRINIGGRDTNELVLATFKHKGIKPIITDNQLLVYALGFDRKYYEHFYFSQDTRAFEKFLSTYIEPSFYVLLQNDYVGYYKEFFEENNLVILGSSGYYTLLERE